MFEIKTFLIAFLIVFAARSVCQTVMNRLNIIHLRRHGAEVPGVFKGFVDEEKLAKIAGYTADCAGFGLVSNLFDQTLILAIILSGFLPWLTEKVSFWAANPIGAGLVFFALLSVLLNVPRIPFSLYDTFVIEARHGFNTRTLRTWFLDLVKGTLLSVMLGGIILCLLLILINSLRHTWWLWAWLVLAVFEGIILWLYPVVIAPWFNTFEPIGDATLEHRIRHLLGKAGLCIKGVFQMDAGRRTRHTNAYFTGLGRTKRIVLFDTLLKSHPNEEILAILSHEAGHWKQGHLVKQLVLLAAVSLAGLFILAQLLEWPLLYRAFGFHDPVAFVGLFLAGIVMSQVGYFCGPLASAVSRRFERQADDAATQLSGSTMPLRQALRKLALDNLTNLNPHPLYVWFHYSHPPIVERIERLERMERDRKIHEEEPAII